MTTGLIDHLNQFTWCEKLSSFPWDPSLTSILLANPTNPVDHSQNETVLGNAFCFLQRDQGHLKEFQRCDECNDFKRLDGEGKEMRITS